MLYTQVVFSPTGGTRKVSELLISTWTENWNTVDISDMKFDKEGYSFKPEDIVLNAVPSYGGRVPAIAARRISNLHGNGAKAVLVCVYGNRAYEDTLVELEDIATGVGFKVMAAVAAVAEHSIMHQYAAGRPDIEDQKQLADYSGQILEKLNSETVTKLSVPGNRPYKKAGGAGLVPKTGKACNKCGLCAEQCPVGAISKENAALVDKKTCISCMRCVVNCPQKAKTLNGAMVGAASLALKKACSIPKKCELYI